LSDYRLYSIKDGHFWRCEEIRAESDEAAIAEARRRQQGLPGELWAGARKVKLLDAAKASAPTNA
jgi:hypothetical protein